MKYKNVSGFRQFLILEGKKTVIFADAVIEVSHPLMDPSFEQVDESTEVTHKARSIKRPSNADRVNPLEFQNRIEEVKKEAQEITQTKISEIASTQTSELAALREELAQFKVVVFRRLEILKGVVKTLEYEVGQLYPEDEDEGADEQKPFHK